MGRLRDKSSINLIVIHCSATPDGRWVTAEDIDRWHQARNFNRDMTIAPYHAPHLQHIGYHFVIYTTGAVAVGRPLRETGAHVAGYNARSIGICMVGTEKFTEAQWNALKKLAGSFMDYTVNKNDPIRIVGHRDLSPDKNNDGVINKIDWLKICPGFSVKDWLKNSMTADPAHVLPHEEITNAPATPDRHYKVQPGDSLWKISKEFNVTIADLKNWNALSGDLIQIGQNLIIQPGEEDDEI